MSRRAIAGLRLVGAAALLSGGCAHDGETPPLLRTAAAAATPVTMAPQRLYAPAAAAPDAPDLASRFRTARARAGWSRLAIVVNRGPIDDASAPRAVAGTQRIARAERPGAAEGTRDQQTLFAGGAPRRVDPEQQVLERGVVRTVAARLAGSGAQIVDPALAAQLLPGALAGGLDDRGEPELVARQRRALAATTDVVLEVLWRQVPLVVESFAGSAVKNACHVEVTAYRVSDARVLGQAGGSSGAVGPSASCPEVLDALLGPWMEDVVARTDDR